MSRFNVGAAPGIQAKQESEEVQITWGHENLRIFDSLPKIAAASTDAGNTPTTTLRAGLVLAKNTSDLWVPYDPDSGSLTGTARGILAYGVDMLNSVTHIAENKNARVLIGGLVKAGQCINLDRRARAALSATMLFDDDLVFNAGPSGFLGQARQVITKAADYTVVVADNGTLFLATAAVNFTLPTKANGLVFEFMQTADANMVVTGNNDIVVKGDAAASTVTFSTSSQKIGSRVRLECVYSAASTLVWIVANLGDTTMTIA